MIITITLLLLKSCTVFVIPRETGVDYSILDDEQIENLLNEDVECVDSTYEQTENILNEIQLQNFGDGSIFTGNFNIICWFSDLLR